MRQNEFYELVDFTQRTLGINDHQTRQYADELSRTFGGERIYITGAQHASQRIIEEIRSQYDGTNVSKLAKQYGFSRQYIHRIVSK
jgi:Mor family transcriptional regulator